MARPIYFSLFLLVLCLIYEAYGGHYRVTHTRMPSRIISNNDGSYDSSSSSTTAADADAEENAAVADTGATPESAATSLSSSSPLRKSFNSNNSFGYNGNRGLGLNSKSMPGSYYGQKSNDMTLENPNIGKRQNSMTSGVRNTIPLSGLYDRNFQNNRGLEDPNIRKRPNSINSDFQGFQGFPNFSNLLKTKVNPSASRLGRQNTLYPSSNEDDSQQTSVGNDNSSMMNRINSFKNSLNGQNMIVKSVRRCCINGDCRVLQDGEECSINDYFTKMKKTQNPNNPMFITSSNGDNDFHTMMSKLMDTKVKPSGQSSFDSYGSDSDDFQETGKPTDMRLGSMRYSTTIPSVGSSNSMGSYVNMPQKKKPINYPYSDPIGLSEEEANEIRDKVLQKSNLYREKYNLDPLVLDDMLNNCAQDWANQMAKSEIFDHRPNNVYGENLYANSDFNNLGENAVEEWYNEITKFNIDDEETQLSGNARIHHMTQLLWKPSNKLGVGVSKNPKNGMYNVVANYDPKGNVIGFFKDNLPEIKQEDIEEAMESQNQSVNSEPKSTWSSSSSSPLQSEWDYEPY